MRMTEQLTEPPRHRCAPARPASIEGLPLHARCEPSRRCDSCRGCLRPQLEPSATRTVVDAASIGWGPRGCAFWLDRRALPLLLAAEEQRLS